MGLILIGGLVALYFWKTAATPASTPAVQPGAAQQPNGTAIYTSPPLSTAPASVPIATALTASAAIAEPIPTIVQAPNIQSAVAHFDPYAGCDPVQNGILMCRGSVVRTPNVPSAPPAYLDGQGNIVFLLPLYNGWQQLGRDGSMLQNVYPFPAPDKAQNITSAAQLSAAQLATWIPLVPSLTYPNPPADTPAPGMSGIRTRWAA